MSGEQQSTVWRWVVLAGAVTIAGLAGIWRLMPASNEAVTEAVTTAESQRPGVIPKGRNPAVMATPNSAHPDPAPPEAGSKPAAEENASESAEDEIAMAWAAVDMAEVRRAMPENLYWKLSLPTKDPKVQEERAAERDRWNVEYGKILSGTGSEEEIRSFYDHRARLSGDYIEFATYLLDHYREQLPERDVSMLELARRMHNARLEEIPRKYEEALERKRQQDAAREAWLAGEVEFAAPGPDSQ
ncbi:MAG: hypothetical protein HY699_14455 [Deltaproteobacteria bacterium]|nr:hypothetical protein [Deltaproteobacteria bacterium]